LGGDSEWPADATKYRTGFAHLHDAPGPLPVAVEQRTDQGGQAMWQQWTSPLAAPRQALEQRGLDDYSEVAA
jgi:hypothetical protein